MTHCKIHSKAKAKEKQEAYEARFKAERDAASARRRRQEMRDEAITLLRQIADGHNDPRTAARDFIAEYDKGESA